MMIWEWIKNFADFLRSRFFLITWISIIFYLFYTTFDKYSHGRRYYYLRRMLGMGLCVSRGTATVLNLCSALVLLPLCKKLNQLVYWMLHKLWPGLFFFWLERVKSIHMTVAFTLLIFSVIHSISHFANLWNFSRGYDEVRNEINFAAYKNENPFRLLLTQAGVTGVSMLMITLCMGLTSVRVIRKRFYNAFWYTHQLYILFIVLLIIHPLSGALKEEVILESSPDASQLVTRNVSATNPKFIAIKSQTWLWMAIPLTCFTLDLIWRISTRNLSKIDILEVFHMTGRTISLTLSSPPDQLLCRMGQYILLQCTDISLMEWHPFTLVKLPTSEDSRLVLWIRVRGDWTIALEKLLLERNLNRINMLVDGPFSSPMEGVSRSEIAICIAAGVGITPFVSVLQHLYCNPRSRLPGRIHLLWIIRNEKEITWLADLANKCLLQLRNANRPDRLHLEFHVTNTKTEESGAILHTVVIEKMGEVKNILIKKIDNGEKESLLTPITRRHSLKTEKHKADRDEDKDFEVAKKYPLLGCRVKRGRPHWDGVFGYWVHLYPKYHLDVYCCGPKKLVKLLRKKCRTMSSTTKTKFTFVHEGFA